jgi:hypothetical protein
MVRVPAGETGGRGVRRAARGSGSPRRSGRARPRDRPLDEEPVVAAFQQDQRPRRWVSSQGTGSLRPRGDIQRGAQLDGVRRFVPLRRVVADLERPDPERATSGLPRRRDSGPSALPLRLGRAPGAAPRPPAPRADRRPAIGARTTLLARASRATPSRPHGAPRRTLRSPGSSSLSTILPRSSSAAAASPASSLARTAASRSEPVAVAVADPLPELGREPRRGAARLRVHARAPLSFCSAPSGSRSALVAASPNARTAVTASSGSTAVEQVLEIVEDREAGGLAYPSPCIRRQRGVAREARSRVGVGEPTHRLVDPGVELARLISDSTACEPEGERLVRRRCSGRRSRGME